MRLHQAGLRRGVARIQLEHSAIQFRSVVARRLRQPPGFQGRVGLGQGFGNAALPGHRGLDLVDHCAFGLDLGDHAGQLLGQVQIAGVEGGLDIGFDLVEQVADRLQGVGVVRNEWQADLRNVLDRLLRNIEALEIDVELLGLRADDIAESTYPPLLIRILGLCLGFGPFRRSRLVLGMHAPRYEGQEDAHCEQQISHLNHSSCCR